MVRGCDAAWSQAFLLLQGACGMVSFQLVLGTDPTSAQLPGDGFALVQVVCAFLGLTGEKPVSLKSGCSEASWAVPGLLLWFGDPDL